jgi:divalent metal cation (Fe/Co/Zn/Cd) transporter
MAEHSSTRRTVLIAGAANLFVGVIKLAAGILVGSSAMLAEAAHSAADRLNQAFLLTSLHRGGARPTAGTRSATFRTATSGRC